MVYNLRVDGPHEYFANGVLVGNCDALRYICCRLYDRGGAWEPTPDRADRNLIRVSPADAWARPAAKDPGPDADVEAWDDGDGPAGGGMVWMPGDV